MQPLPRATTSAFLHAFWGVRQQIFRSIGPTMRELHDVDLPEHFLLEYVADSDLSPTEIADALSLPAHAISRRLESLEQRGWLTRHVHPDDARRRRLVVTDDGRRAQQAAARTLHRELARLLSTVDAAELDRCVDTLRHLGPARRDPAQDPLFEEPQLQATTP